MPEEYAKSLADMLAKLYGVRTDYRVNPLTEECMIAVTPILPINPRRLSCVIMNLSANLVYIAPDQQVSAARGIRLQTNGGSVSKIWNEDFELVTMPWYGIAAADNSDIITIEVFIV